MKVRMVWVQGDDETWLEEAWDDESIAVNYDGWCEAVNKVRQKAHENNYEVRLQIVDVPHVHDLFDVAEVKAREITGVIASDNIERGDSDS